jgi:hypothetical protein
MTAPLSHRGGDGAMLARLIGLGRRCGIAPEAVLLHVLDGAPLPEAPTAAKLKAGETRIYTTSGQLLRQTPPQPESLDLIRFARFGNLGESARGSSSVPEPAAPTVPPSQGATTAIASPDEQERVNLLNDQIAETAAIVAERLASPGGSDGAGGIETAPAADPLAPDEADSLAAAAEPLFRAGTKADQALTLWATGDLDFAAIAAEIGSTPATVYERIRQGKKHGDPRWQQGFARRNQVPNPQPDAEPANAGGDHEVAQQQEQDATVGAAGEPSEGVEPVAPENSAETANEAPMAVDGDGVAVATAPPSQSISIPPTGEHGEARRGQTAPDVSPEGAPEVAGEIPGTPPAPDQAGSPAPPPFDPEEKGTVRRESGSAVRPARPGADHEAPTTQPELADDVVCTLNAGVIVGPRGSLNGFPLINAVLQVLAAGELLPSGVVATRAGVRSGPAVLALLRQWTDDLEKIGVEVIRFGPEDVRIKRGRH